MMMIFLFLLVILFWFPREEEANTPSVKPKVLPNKSVKKVKPPPASSGSMPSEIPEYSASKIVS